LAQDDHEQQRRGGATPSRPVSDEQMFGPDGLAQRIQAAVYGAVGCLPRRLRAWAAMICQTRNLQHLTEAMTRWIQGGHLDRERFGELFLGRNADDPLVDLLYSAAPRVGLATGHAELGDAAAKIAAAILVVGPDRWARFVADLQDRALDPATIAIIECRPQPAPASDPGHAPPHCESPAAPQEENSALQGENSAAPRGDDPTAEPTRPAHLPPHVTARAGGGRAGAETGPWGLPPAEAVPPVRNPARLQPGTASLPSMAATGGPSLWDEQGGEWQYHPGDLWHNPHWNYNEHSQPNTPWRSIPIGTASPWKA
jgi:hypothetical protein